ncbi:lipase family protein [bacterium]|nr:lipase family protein [bacterium]
MLRRLLLTIGFATLLGGCGSDGHHGGGATPTPTPVIGQEQQPFDLGLALALGRLCLQSYQMLTDYEQGTTFSLPPPYTLQAQYLTPEHYPGEPFSSEVPIAFVATSGNAIYVVFRGTKTIAEWISDATFTQVPYAPVSGGGKTETGFTTIYETVNTAIIAEVNGLAASSGYTTLYVTGHSLGAALATLAAPELARATRFSAPILYNFASPRVGDPEFASLVDALPTSWRIANSNDEVPKLPPAVAVVFHGDDPTFYFYEHIDSEYGITFGRPIRDLTDLEEDHAMCNYYATLCDRTDTPTACKRMAGGADGCDPG